MGFLGPVVRVGGRLVRPHDLVLATSSERGGTEAQVQRVVHLGFEVRVDLAFGDGGEACAQVTRGEAQELELAAGDVVWVRVADPQPVSA
jgi:sulfate transport system ATP-binding protein